ncbi:MAG: hypothetical protein IKC59_08495 [Clostridia bacterium]|nr:hypothetical protein [Clostridia bacterium]
MKTRIRLLGLFLTVCVLIGSLTSCAPALLWDLAWDIYYDREVITTDPVVESDTQASAQPEELPSDLEYSLTSEDVDAFYALLAQCEQAYLSETTTQEELDSLDDRFTDAYYHIVTQSQLAYIRFCMATKDSEASDDYLFASKASADAYDAYMQMCKRIDESDSPWRETFFSDWSDSELEQMRGFSQELTELSLENDQLLVDYRELDEDDFYLGASDYYVQLVTNNNRIAVLNGYENYWEYAYAEIYGRDYGKDEIVQMREYVSTYVTQMCADAIEAFQWQFQRLTRREQTFVKDLLQDARYDAFATDYVSGYLSTFDDEAEASMKGLFDKKNSVFATAEGAYQGAFTTYLHSLNRPVCYFGPSYQNVGTVIHEMGHYYSYLLNGRSNVQMDLAEVQSQGNEWLFCAYLNTVLDEDVARAVYSYQLYSALTTVLVGTMVDQFEQTCYEMQIDSTEDADAVMAGVMAQYGGREWVEYYVTDMDAYWRYVTVENSVYYVSYAVSMLAAVQIYSVAETQSYATGMEIYLSLMKPKSGAFLAAVTSAGLKSPMEEALYRELMNLI